MSSFLLHVLFFANFTMWYWFIWLTWHLISFLIEYLDNLHNKSSSGTNLSTKIDDPIDLVPLQFNTSCTDLGQAAGQSKLHC